LDGREVRLPAKREAGGARLPTETLCNILNVAHRLHITLDPNKLPDLLIGGLSVLISHAGCCLEITGLGPKGLASIHGGNAQNKAPHPAPLPMGEREMLEDASLPVRERKRSEKSHLPLEREEERKKSRAALADELRTSMQRPAGPNAPMESHRLEAAGRLGEKTEYSLVLTRHRRSPAFDARDARVLDLLKPHWEIAMANAIVLTGLARAKELAEMALRLDGKIALVAAEDGSVLYATGMAGSSLELVARVEGLPSGSFPAHSLPSWLAAAVKSSQPSRNVTWKRARPRAGGKAVWLCLTPLDQGGNLRLVEVLDEDARQAFIPRLTPRQTEVSRHVALGLGNREVAQRLGVSPETVRKTLRKVYLQAGLASRAELAAALLPGGLLSPARF
jgi:DNA-binding CsgD family transcriptional regulator